MQLSSRNYRPTHFELSMILDEHSCLHCSSYLVQALDFSFMNRWRVALSKVVQIVLTDQFTFLRLIVYLVECTLCARARSLARSHVIRNMGGIFIAVEQLAQVASGANAFKMWVQPQAVCYLLISPSSLKTNKELPFLFTMMHIRGKGGFLG